MAKAQEEGGVTVNMKQISAILAVILTLASAVGAAYITYDTSRANKEALAGLEVRVRETERRQDKFEGIMEERTKNILDHVNNIERFMQKLVENLELDDG